MAGAASCERGGGDQPAAFESGEARRDEENPGPAEADWISIVGGEFDDHRLDTFEMMRTEVTTADYGRCVDAGACTGPAPE